MRTESTNGEIAATMGSAPPELEDGPPDRDAVTLLERVLPDRLLVHLGAVGRAKVGQQELPIPSADLGMLPARRRVRHDDVGFGEPSDQSIASAARFVPVPTQYWMSSKVNDARTVPALATIARTQMIDDSRLLIIRLPPS